MTPFYSAAGLVLVALITAVSTWLVARRTTSGNIDTSEAAKLWDEGTKMRLELRAEVSSLKTQLIEAVQAIEALHRDITNARKETESAREETRKSRAETRLLMGQIEALHLEVKTSDSLSIGALAENAEIRRILLIPEEDRTFDEISHLAEAEKRRERPTELEKSKEEEVSDGE